jgi:cytochrome P450
MTSTIRSQTSAPIPGPRALPGTGQTLAGLRLAAQPLTLLKNHYQTYGAFSGLTAFPNGAKGTVLALGPDFNQAVLSNPGLFYSPDLSILQQSALTRLTSGLVSMNGERHRQQRRLMMPSFHRQAVAGYAGLMAHYTADMLRRWQNAGQINLMPELRQLILRIVSHTLFGLDDPAENENLGKLLFRWTRLANSPVYVLLPPLRRQLYRLSEQLERELMALISRKRAAGGDTNDVLSTLIQAHDEDGARLTDTELIGQLAILFIAGHETTVNALAWTLILLARHPALRLELSQTLQSTLNGAAPAVEQAYALPLLDHVVRESMRLLPPVIYTARIAHEAAELGDYALAKDSAIILSQFITHRLPEIYPQPDHFLPRRWAHLDVSPYQYLPFSAGSRMCIGATFASLEIRIVLAMLLPRLQVAPLAKVDYQAAGNVLLPKGDVPCAVYPAGEQRPASGISGSLDDLLG